MIKLFIPIMLVMLLYVSALRAEIGNPAPVDPNSFNSTTVKSTPRNYVGQLNEQTRATKLLLNLLGMKKFQYSPESIKIGKDIESIVSESYDLAYDAKTGKVDTQAWHQFTDIAINQMASSMKSDVISPKSHVANGLKKPVQSVQHVNHYISL